MAAKHHGAVDCRSEVTPLPSVPARIGNTAGRHGGGMTLVKQSFVAFSSPAYCVGCTTACCLWLKTQSKESLLSRGHCVFRPFVLISCPWCRYCCLQPSATTTVTLVAPCFVVAPATHREALRRRRQGKARAQGCFHQGDKGSARERGRCGCLVLI